MVHKNDLIGMKYLKWRHDHSFNAVIHMKLATMVNSVTFASYFKNDLDHYLNYASLVAAAADRSHFVDSARFRNDTFYN